MERTDLEGVLQGMLVKHLDDGPALDELHTRINKAVGRATDAKTWGRFRAKWLTNVARYATKLPTVRVVTAAALDRVTGQLAIAEEALSEAEAQRRTLAEQVSRLVEAKTAEEVSEILLPKDEIERFEHLQAEASAAIRKLDGIVAEAMWYDLFEGGMPWPDRFEGGSRLERAEEATRDGTLIDDGNERLVPDQDIAVVANAYEAVERLRKVLSEPSERFYEWFHKEHGMGPDLRKKRLWENLLY